MLKDTLNISELNKVNGFEKVIIFSNQSPSVKGIIAIHNTLRGPALGGCRIHHYANFQDGLNDVLSLARAMTFKNTMMNLPYGGGKAIIFQNNQFHRNASFRVFAEVLNQLNGTYLSTDDVGTSVQDMYYLRKFTKYARGIYYNERQIPATSYGVYQAIRATYNYYANKKKSSNSLKGIKVAVQGLGKVGYQLCRYLHKEGCKLYVNDKIEKLVIQAVQEFNAEPIYFDQTNHFEADVFSPCALGSSITKDLLSKIHVKYIIGGENNPLASYDIAKLLDKKGVVYIPDYISNAGGVIDIACEGHHYSEEFVFKKIESIYDKTIEILNTAQLTNKTPLEISNKYVQEQLNSVSLSKR